MANKPSYEELDRRINELEKESVERQRAEEALLSSEKKFRGIAERSFYGILTVDLGGRVTYISPAVEKMTGYAQNEVLKANFQDFFPTEELPKIVHAFAEVKQGNLIEMLELKTKRKNGTLLSIECNGSPILQDGTVIGAQVVFRDIAERKRAEEALRESKERYRFLAENMGDIVWTVDLDLNTTFVSSSVEKVLGYTPEERKRQHLEEIITPESFRRVQARLLGELGREDQSDADPDRAITIDVEYYHKDGSTIWMENSVRALRDTTGTLVGIYGVSRDIGERRKAEEALRKSEEKFRLVYSNSPDYICLNDIEGNCLDANPALLKKVGFSLDEIQQKTFWDFFAGENLEELMNSVAKVRTGQRIEGLEVSARTRSGEIFDFEVNAVPLTEEGEVARVLSLARDITDRKRAEAEKAKLEEQLRQALKMEAIGTLAGGIAHDFNNLLGVIVGNTELAMIDVPQWSPARANLEEVQKACLRARDMVRQILAFSRKTVEEQKPVRVSSIVEESLKLLRSSIPSTIEIRESLACRADTILADATQISQILMNLCTNAAHAMREKGGVLEVSLNNAELDIDASALHPDLTAGDYMVLNVRDTGHGMEPEIIERIFDPYFTTKGAGEGTGMGLSVVHGIVRSHGGAIRVKSQPGKGTSFDLFLPLEDTQDEPASDPPARLSAGSERILFVDDEPALVDLGRQMLRRLGYEVTVRTCSIEALETFRDQPESFDLVVTDMTMPNMTGKDLSQELLRIRPGVPVILCTGFSEMITEEKARQMGIRAFLTKPLVMQEMAETVRNVLDQKKDPAEG